MRTNLFYLPWLTGFKEPFQCLWEIYVGIYEIRDAGQHIFSMT